MSEAIHTKAYEVVHVQPSPYRPGRLANTLPGREQELLAADERLSRLCDLGELVGRVDVFTAARGYGKTSLLREIQRRAEARGATTAWVTAGEEHGVVAAVVEALTAATRTWRDAGKSLVPALEQARISLNLGVASAEATVRPRERPAASGARAFEQLLRGVVEAGRRQDRRAVVILIDEVQSADQAGLRTIAYAWQHLQAEGEDVPAAVFAAGLPDTSRAIVDAVSSSERFAYADLAPLDAGAVVRALVDASRSVGVEWDRPGLQLAVQAAGGYPFTVQLIGQHAWELAEFPDAGTVIAVEIAQQACERAQQEMARLIEDRFVRSSPAEQQFMLAMAAAGDGPARRADVADRMGVSSNHVSNQRDSLLKNGLIRSASYGTVEFTIPGMAAYLRVRADVGPQVRGWEFARPGSEVITRAREIPQGTERSDRPSPGPQPDLGQQRGD